MEENNNPNQKEQQNINNNPQQEQFQYQPQGGQQQPQYQNFQQPNGAQQAPKKKSNAGIIIAIIVGVLLLLSIPVILVLVGVISFIGKNGSTIRDVSNSITSNYNEYYNYYDDENTTSKNTTNNNSTSKNTTSKNTTSKDNTTSKNTTSQDNTSNSSATNAKESTVESPLKLNQWGLAAKYASKYLSEEYADTNYVDVPVRVTKVTRGEDAEKIVKDWCDKSSFYKYEEPKASTEWVVFDYEVDLTGLTFDKGTIGTDAKITSAVKGLNGGSVKYNDITYILSTRDISDSDYKKEPGVYKGKFVVTLPEGCTEYLVKLGDSYNGAESYFRVEE